MFEVGISQLEDLEIFDWDTLAELLELAHFSALKRLYFSGDRESSARILDASPWISAKLPSLANHGILVVGWAKRGAWFTSYYPIIQQYIYISESITYWTYLSYQYMASKINMFLPSSTGFITDEELCFEQENLKYISMLNPHPTRTQEFQK